MTLCFTAEQTIKNKKENIFEKSSIRNFPTLFHSRSCEHQKKLFQVKIQSAQCNNNSCIFHLKR